MRERVWKIEVPYNAYTTACATHVEPRSPLRAEEVTSITPTLIPFVKKFLSLPDSPMELADSETAKSTLHDVTLKDTVGNNRAVGVLQQFSGPKMGSSDSVGFLSMFVQSIKMNPGH